MAEGKYTLSKLRQDLRAASADELQTRLQEAQKELLTLRYQVVQAGQLENPMRISEVRKTIARIHTLLRERELQAQG